MSSKYTPYSRAQLCKSTLMWKPAGLQELREGHCCPTWLGKAFHKRVCSLGAEEQELLHLGLGVGAQRSRWDVSVLEHAVLGVANWRGKPGETNKGMTKNLGMILNLRYEEEKILCYTNHSARKMTME